MGTQTIATYIRDLYVSGILYKPDVVVEVHDEEYSDRFRISVTAHWDATEATASVADCYLSDLHKRRDALKIISDAGMIDHVLDLLAAKIVASRGTKN